MEQIGEQIGLAVLWFVIGLLLTLSAYWAARGFGGLYFRSRHRSEFRRVIRERGIVAHVH